MADLASLRAAIAVAMLSDDPAGPLEAVGAVAISALPVDGGAFTIMSSDANRQTVAASDSAIAAVEESQYELGEGPTLQAFATGRAVVLRDVAAETRDRWPMFHGAVSGLPVGSLCALPMQLGVVTVGVCVLYRGQPGLVSSEDLAVMLAVVDVTTFAFLALPESLRPRGASGWADEGSPARSQVHQATGMLIAQLDVNAEEAFARLRAHAFSHAQPLDEVADDIVSLRLRLAEGRAEPA